MTASRLLYLLVILGMVPFLAAWRWSFAIEIGLLYDTLLLIIVLADFRLTPGPVLVTGRREVPDRLSIGRANAVELEIANQGTSELTCLVRDEYPATLESDVSEFDFRLLPQSKAKLRYFLIPRERGSYHFGDIYIRYLSYFGLFWRQRRIACAKDVKVFSDLQALHELSVKLSHSTELGELSRRRRGQGTEFASLREYSIGDDSRSIDWKATARRDRPVVRTYDTQQEQVLLILVDAGRMMVSELDGLSRYDHALNAALSLALAALSGNDQVGLGIFADRPLLFMPPRRGKGQLKKFLEVVFDTRPRMVEPDYIGVLSYFASVQRARSLMVVLTDLTDPAGSQTLLTGLASLSPRHLPFCVTLKDRQIDRLASTSTRSLRGIYQRAVAVDLLSQRELALSVLARRGCLILDCPPQELSDQLVERYLEIKMRGRL